MLTEIVIRKWRAVSAAARAALFAAFAVGMLANLMMATNHLINHDSVLYALAGQSSDMLSQGKWLTGFFEGLRGNTYAMSVIVPVTMLLLAVSAAMIVSFLHMKSPLWGALSGALLALMPTVFVTYAYHGFAFFFALFFAALAVYAFKWGKKGAALAVVFLTLSLGTYAAYIGLTAGLMVLDVLLYILQKDASAKDAWKRGLRYVLVLAVSVALYYGILKLSLALTGTALSDYRGIDQMGSVRLSALPSVAWKALRKVGAFFLSDRYGASGAAVKWLYRAAAALAGALLCGFAMKNGALRKPSRALTLALLVLLFPFAIHAVAILGQDAKTTWRMIYPFSLAFVFLFKLADEMEVKCFLARARAGLSLLVAVALTGCGIGYCWFLTANEGYQRMYFAYENAYAMSVRLAGDICGQPGYTKDTRVAFIEETEMPNAFSDEMGYFSYMNNYPGARDSDFLSHSVYIVSFISQYLGFDFKYADVAGDYALCARTVSYSMVDALDIEPLDADALAGEFTIKDVCAMPAYPEAGSIRVSGDYVFVKLSEYTGVYEAGALPLNANAPYIPCASPEVDIAEDGRETAFAEGARYRAIPENADVREVYIRDGETVLTLSRGETGEFEFDVLSLREHPALRVEAGDGGEIRVCKIGEYWE